MRKTLHLSVLLILIDQSIKLFISNFLRKAYFPIISGILYFHPVQNKNLCWYASIFNYHLSIVQMVMLQVLALFLAVLLARYCIFIFSEKRGYIDKCITFFTAGLICSFLDVIFWGGSLDFMDLSNYFIFDIKDIYLSIGEVFLVLFIIKYLQMYYSLGKEARKEQKKREKFLLWIKHGCPISYKVQKRGF